MLRRVCPLLVGCLLLLTAGAVHADPAPPFESTIIDPTAYDFVLDVTDPGGSGNPSASDWQYVYTVTFHGGDYAASQATDDSTIRMAAFVVYAQNNPVTKDSDSTAEVSHDDGTNWGTLAWSPTPDGNKVVWEWNGEGGPYVYPHPPDLARFTLWTDAPLDLHDPVRTAVKIKWDEDGSDWVNNTPELPPSLLSMISFGALALVRRWRRT
ncbi:MAG: hypothetical protein ACE5R4_17905 [Armatimonadota bacterium]